MPFEPIRFIHASNFRLDSQLSGIDDCPDDFRESIEDATIAAFARVVAASIDRRADFVLLTGNSFDENEPSLPARLALLDGFQRLAEHGIRVFVLPGESDPADAWRAIPQLPENATTFYDRSDEAVAVLRDGKVIATVACATNISWISGTPCDPSSDPVGNAADRAAEADARAAAANAPNSKPGTMTPDSQTPAPTPRRDPFRIGLHFERGSHRPPPSRSQGENSSDVARSHDAESPLSLRIAPAAGGPSFDYLAVGGPEARLTLTSNSGLVHIAGATQAVCADDTGPHGCTLVDVDADGTIRCEFVPTAPVRRERLAVAVEPAQSRDDLIEAMQRLLDERTPQPGELLWLVDWTLRGRLPEEIRSLPRSRVSEPGVFEPGTERNHESEQPFLQWLERRPGRADLPPMLHTFKVLPDRPAAESLDGFPRPSDSDERDICRTAPEARPADAFFDALEEDVLTERSELVDAVRELPSASAAWANYLDRLLDDVADDTVRGRARDYGNRRFGL